MSGRSKDVASAYDARSVTKSDSTIIPTTRALYIGGTGDLAVRMASGASVTYVGVAAGIFPIQVDQVLAATTATNIVALY